MRTDKQSEASRNNGKKSQGPVTDHGKANSAKNANSHNLAGDHFALLSNEDPNVFAIHENEYLQRFQPIDGVEYDLVQKMIIASWRERRVLAMEAALLEIEMARQAEDVDVEFTVITPPARQVLALFGTNDATTASALLLRYGSTARRAYTSAFRTLRELQGDRFNRKPNSSYHYNHQSRNTSATSTAARTEAAEPEAAPANRVTNNKIVLREKLGQGEMTEPTPKIAELRNEPEPVVSAAPQTAAATARAFAA